MHHKPVRGEIDRVRGDLPQASVWVDSAQPMGLLITNGEFTSFITSQWGQPSLSLFPLCVCVCVHTNVTCRNLQPWVVAH